MRWKLETQCGEASAGTHDVIMLDEVCYVPLADFAAEFLFQVIAETPSGPH